jgi:diphthamide biosynthesis protein 7
VLYGLVRRHGEEEEDFSLKHLSKFSLSIDEERLALSLDWDVRNKGQLLVSDSKGQLTVLVLTSSKALEVVHTWKAHDFEAWTSAFDLWSSGRLRVFSGGDDCKLKCFDVERSDLTAGKHVRQVRQVRQTRQVGHLLSYNLQINKHGGLDSSRYLFF